MDTTDHVTLADFRPDRLNELVFMWRASFEAGSDVTDLPPISEQQNYLLTEVVPNNQVRLAILDGEIVGFVAASRTSVEQLYVRVGFQHIGIGTKLLRWAKSQSAGCLSLFTFATNNAARLFYERHGFVEVERGFESMWQLETVKYTWSALEKPAA